MILTVADESKYLIDVTQYMIKSLNKVMPEQKLCVTIVNGTGKYDELILSWHRNIYINHIQFECGGDKGIYFTFMALPIPDLLKSTDEPILYLDGDIIVRESLEPLFHKLNEFDLLVRYRPYLDFVGPMGTKYGARVNSGVVAISNNSRTLRLFTEFKESIIDHVLSGKDNQSYNDGGSALTGVDQELLWNLIFKYRESVAFFPLDDKFNDSSFLKDSYIWHAKGVHRNYSEYLLECHRYGKNDINIKSLKFNFFVKKIKKILKKGFLKFVNCFSEGKNSNPLALRSKNERILVVGSDLLIENIDFFLTCDSLLCVDVDPVLYYKNSSILSSKDIRHQYMVPDFPVDFTECFDVVASKKKDVIFSEQLLAENMIEI